MQIVIDISEEDYFLINRNNFCRNKWKVYEAIKNGAPLPKNHGRLIDANDVDISLPSFGTDDWIRDQMTEAKIDYLYSDDEDKVFEFGKRLVKGFMNVVDTAPTIIEADKAESEVNNE